jgi:hypothetical protein
MLTKSELPIDYLKVPTNQKIVKSIPRRTSSFPAQPSQLDERIASNLSLQSVGNSILKQPNSHHQHQSTSSHLSVHYSTNENENKINLSPSLILPTIESTPLIENNQVEDPQTNNHHFSKMPIQCRLCELLQRRTWSNPFPQRRYENGTFNSIELLFMIIYFNQIESGIGYINNVYIKCKFDILSEWYLLLVSIYVFYMNGISCIRFA